MRWTCGVKSGCARSLASRAVTATVIFSVRVGGVNVSIRCGAGFENLCSSRYGLDCCALARRAIQSLSLPVTEKGENKGVLSTTKENEGKKKRSKEIEVVRVDPSPGYCAIKQICSKDVKGEGYAYAKNAQPEREAFMAWLPSVMNAGRRLKVSFLPQTLVENRPRNSAKWFR